MSRVGQEPRERDIEHYTVAIFKDEVDGRWWAECFCGWRSEIATDNYAEEHLRCRP